MYNSTTNTTAYHQAAAEAQHTILRHPPEAVSSKLRRLAELAAEYEQAGVQIADAYGVGEHLQAFEARMAKLLGKPAAIILPSGTLAQPLALKIHAQAAGKQQVLLHPTSHLVLHEQQGYEALWALQGQLVGHADEVLTAAHLAGVNADNAAALILELPMREVGGQLPSWEDIQAQVTWAREIGLKVHLDGARLWQCEPFYQRSMAEIAGLFDSVYVSFYKDIGGIAGAVLAGSEAFVAEARVWSRRAGGNLISLYPYVLAAELGLQDNLAAVAEATAYAKPLAALFNQIPGVVTVPKVPQAALFHVHIRKQKADLIQCITDYAARHGVLLLPLPRTVLHEGRADEVCVCEIPLGRAAMQQPPEFWAEHLQRCLT